MAVHAPSIAGHSSPQAHHTPKASAAKRPSGQHLAAAGRGKPMPDPVRAKMEHAFGHDFSRVRIHEGGAAESLGAQAFTRGTDLHFAPGRYSPTTRGGQELLGHELAHVVQQKQGRVAVPQGKGAPINADPALEAEADRLGAEAARTSWPVGTGPSGPGRSGSGSAGARSTSAGAAHKSPSRAGALGEKPAAAPRAAESSAAVQQSTAAQPVQCNGNEEENQGAGNPGVAAGAAGYGTFILRNLYQQRRAAQGGGHNPASRLGALMATRRFRPGQVGHGVHANISWIHALMGGVGQSNIGSLFNSSQAQRMMGLGAGSPANLGLGMLEHSFWLSRLRGQGANGAATPGERFGGALGSSVFPRVRAGLQSGAGIFRSMAPRLAMRMPAIAAAGLLGGAAHNAYQRLQDNDD